MKNPKNDKRQTPAERAGLKFDKNGRFRILAIADIQDSEKLSDVTASFVKEAVRQVKPDLIVLTGDNIYGTKTRTYEKSALALRNVMELFSDSGSFVAAVFGNHDDQSANCTRQQQMEIMSHYPYCIAIDDGLWIDGTHYRERLEHCGTYHIPVYCSDGSKKVGFNIWMFDTGSYAKDGNKGYDHMRERQIKWFEETNERIREENGTDINSIIFQHIIVPEIYDALENVPKKGKDTVVYKKKHYKMPQNAKPGSRMGESCNCSEDNGGEFDAIERTGGVLAVVSGHDHTNSFIVPHRGTDIINIPTAGVAPYGETDYRGVRYFDIFENDTSSYETHLLKYSDVMGHDEAFMKRYKRASFFSELQLRFINIWMNLTNTFGVSNKVG